MKAYLVRYTRNGHKAEVLSFAPTPSAAWMNVLTLELSPTTGIGITDIRRFSVQDLCLLGFNDHHVHLAEQVQNATARN